MADINLLAQESKQYESFENLRKKISVAAVILLVVVSIATLATLAFFTNLVMARGKLIARVDEAAVRVNDFKAVEELAVVTKEKASLAQEIINRRSDKVGFFNNLAQLVPQNVSFSDIKISQQRVTISGQAKTSADIAALVSGLLSSQGATIVSGVSVDSLVSGEGGRYSFGLSANVVK